MTMGGLPGVHTQGFFTWRQLLLRYVAGLFVFEAVSGLIAWLVPFSLSTQFLVLFHTGIGLLFVVPFAITQFEHLPQGWAKGRPFQKWLGIAGFAVAALAGISGLVLTVEAALGTGISYAWHYIHLVSSLVSIPVVLVHVTPLARRLARLWEKIPLDTAGMRWRREIYVLPVFLLVLAGAGVALYSPVNYSRFPLPAGYALSYGSSPFSPSLALTETGQPVAPVALNNSKSCGTVKCHSEVYAEWAIGAHRWSASDPFFLAVEHIMQQEEGAPATRYCAGCHDPVSLLTGYKDASRGLKAPGYDEGSSCLLCHGIRKVDIQGNGNYVWRAPRRYAFENKPGAVPAFLSEFLIRAYPEQHLRDFDVTLSRKPEFCGSCHKQFINVEVNHFGWVQLQNQYDEWKGSRWFRGGEPGQALTCQECHMRLVDSKDPARGDPGDPLRGKDGKHRSHRILAANQVVPLALKLPGAEEQVKLVEEWLRGDAQVPEIQSRWAVGPAIPVAIVPPLEARPGQRISVRVNVTNNKVGHNFPTGPLDIIEGWIEFVAKDESGQIVYHSGLLDESLRVEPGSFVFHSEGVDRHRQVIDRHNLWNMVGVRYRRAIFPGYTDTASYEFTVPRNAGPRVYLSARLRYRKANQDFLDRVIGKGKATAPITDLSSDRLVLFITPDGAPKAPAGQ